MSNFQLGSDGGGCLRWEGMKRYQLRMLSNPLNIQFKVPWESIVYTYLAPKYHFQCTVQRIAYALASVLIECALDNAQYTLCFIVFPI